MALFPPRPAPLANYDWIDLIQKNGYITFYGGTLVQKETKYERYETGDDGSYAISGNDWAAQTFTIGTTGTDEDFYIAKVSILEATDTATDQYVEIQETTAGKPNGTVLAKWGHDGGHEVITTGGKHWFEFHILDAEQVGDIKLETATKYAIVTYQTGANAGGSPRYDSTGAYTGGAAHLSANAGTAWTEQAGEDMLFKIWGSDKSPFVLQSQTFTPASITTTMEARATSTDIDSTSLSLNFDVTVNTTFTVENDAIVEAAVTSNADIIKVDAEVYRVRGVTATSIGSCNGINADNGVFGQISLTKTTFKKGDILRLKITEWIFEDDTASEADATFAHNPATPDIVLKVPFRLDFM